MRKLSSITLSTLLLAVATTSPVIAAVVDPADHFLADFDAASFSDPTSIDNTYFPMINGTPTLFAGSFIDEDGELVTESFELTNLGLGKVLLGVQTRTQLDRAFDGDLLVEETFDYYAQDDAGNVWYFGEDVTNYVYDDDDILIDTNSASSWLAGENDGLPGFIMPIDLTPGFDYWQEFAAIDNAVDVGEISATGLSLTIGGITYNNVLRILETNPLEDDALEFKYYAPGIGLILAEEGLDENFSNPELSVAIQTRVPEPGVLSLLGLGLAGLMRVRSRKLTPAPRGTRYSGRSGSRSSSYSLGLSFNPDNPT